MLSGRMNALPSSTDNISAPARTLKSGGFFSRVEFFEKCLEMERDENIYRRGISLEEGKAISLYNKIFEGISQTRLVRRLEIGVVKRDETESSISRVDRLFLEQREAEKPWPTSFRDSVGNTQAPDE